jgi:hypothetical protein
MGRGPHEPLSVADAKARLRRAATAGPGGVGSAGGDAALRAVRVFARARPWAALGAALATGVAVGASRRARAALPRLLLRLLA